MKTKGIVRKALENYKLGKKLTISTVLINPRIGESAFDVVRRFEEMVAEGRITEEVERGRKKEPVRV